MIHRKTCFILGAVLFLTVGVSTTLGYVPDPQLWFDAKDNPDHPEGWTNLGIAEKSWSPTTRACLCLNRMPDLMADRLIQPKRRGKATAEMRGEYATPRSRRRHGFENWTIEVWLKRDGPAFDNAEHQILGIMDTPPWPRQAVLFFFEQPNNSRIFLAVIGREPANDDQRVLTNIDVA